MEPKNKPFNTIKTRLTSPVKWAKREIAFHDRKMNRIHFHRTTGYFPSRGTASEPPILTIEGLFFINLNVTVVGGRCKKRVNSQSNSQ